MTFLFSITISKQFYIHIFLHFQVNNHKGPDAKAQKCPHKNGSQLEVLKVKKYREFVNRQAVGALRERSDKSDFSLLPWDSFSQEIRNLLLFYCQKSLNLLQMQ